MDDPSARDLYNRLAQKSAGVRTLLDVGCGRGAHLADGSGADTFRSVRDSGGVIIGIDVALPVEGNPHVTELRSIGPDSRWPIDSASVDLAFCDWVLEHVPNPEIFFAECARVLKPSGAFVARTMQTWSVAGIGARLVPSRFHEPMISRLQPGMNLDDVFPTTLRCNTATSLRNLASANGMRLTELRTHRTLHGYGFGRPRVERTLARVERILPRAMHHAIVVSFELGSEDPSAPRSIPASPEAN